MTMLRHRGGEHRASEQRETAGHCGRYVSDARGLCTLTLGKEGTRSVLVKPLEPDVTTRPPCRANLPAFRKHLLFFPLRISA